MDCHRTSTKSSKKTKAVGAFRVFLNFLHKPAKKKYELDHKVEPPAVGSDKEATPKPKPVKDTLLKRTGKWEHFKSWSYSGSDQAVKETCVHPANETVPVKQIPLAHASDGDDDVFLNDSYFEDDYFEDFSSGSNDDQNDDLLDEELDYIDRLVYSNNLDQPNEINDKTYDKPFPDFITQNKSSPTQSFNRNARKRHNSMPCSFTWDSVTSSGPASKSSLNNCDGTSPDTKIELINLLITQPQPESITEVATTVYDSHPMIVNRNISAKQNYKISSDEAIDLATGSNQSLTDNPEIVTVKCRLPSPNKHVLLSTNTHNVNSDVHRAQNSSVLIHHDQDGAFEDLNSCTSGYSKSPSPPTFSAVRELVTCISKDEERIHGHSHRTSVESGYSSATRSSSSTPFSPSASLTTPMNKLHSGNCLSPHSLNALDGISGTKPTPKRILRPKFIFPTLPNTDLKPVPELGESPSSDEQERGDFEPRKQDTAGNVQLNVPLVNMIDLETSQGHVSIELNVSINIMDLNNNVLQPYDESDLSQLVALHPSSPQVLDLSKTASTPVKHPMIDADNILTPFGKVLRPVCTSSPLPHKMPLSMRKVTPRQRVFLESPLAATANHDSGIKSFGLTPCKNKTPVKKKCGRAENNGNATSERRKILKRRSARTRLHFDERDANNNVKDADEMPDSNSRVQQPSSGDYVLLKRIADSIVSYCPNRETVRLLVNLPSLMENLNNEFARLMKTYNDSNPKLSVLKTNIEFSKEMSNLTVQNCLDMFLLSVLVQDLGRISASLDFIFNNLPRVIQRHDYLSRLAPEIVVLLLTNPRCIVRNSHGFPLSYSLSEKEVFKAVVKYVDVIVKRSDKPLDDRIKKLLSTVADPKVLSDISNDTWIKNVLNSNTQWTGPIYKSAPRPRHHLVFEKSSPSNRVSSNRDYCYQPFISTNVQSLEDIAVNNDQTASPIAASTMCKDHFVLRKLYFSYRCHNKIPFITKIGMQYSYKGKKKTVFIAQSRASEEQPQNSKSSEAHPTPQKYDQSRASCNSTCSHEGVKSLSCSSHDMDTSTNEGLELTMVKKAAIVLKSGEHITALSALGNTVIHNIEIVTNTGRRIRSHGIEDVAGKQWVAIATPKDSSSFCLHALYGDQQKIGGRSYIRDLGAIWVSTSYALNDLS